jgi:hypothetical protein
VALLESTKDRLLGVEPLEQLVLPRVRYRMTCLLIRDVIGSVSYSVEWEMTHCLAWDPQGARGPEVRENLSTANGALSEETIAKHDILL